MAKNYANIYSTANDAISLEQRFYLKVESTRGVFEAPLGSDFFFTLGGGSVNLTQSIFSSPHRSGRHNTDIIKEKRLTEWSFSTYFNIDTTLGAAATAEVDPAVRTLFKSLLGKEDNTTSAVFDSSEDPSITFTLMEIGDQMSRQAVGAFVQSGEIQLPGDGQAQVNWSGNAKDTTYAGIALSTVDNNGGNDITLEAGEGRRFKAGAYVMLIEADGSTRSADTPDGSPRRITAVAGDVITVDGAVLADADGSAADVYVCYYEPESPVAINDPQTGLQGSVTIDTLPTLGCVRNATISIANNHELVDYCYGSDSLEGSIFVPGSRVEVNVDLELNLNHDVVEFLNRVEQFESHDINLVLGEATGRRVEFDLPKVIFPVPAVTTPESGSIPITFSGLAYQSALDAADEVTVSYL